MEKATPASAISFLVEVGDKIRAGLQNENSEVREMAKIADELTDIADCLSAKLPKWISVKERLPEESGKYIVCTRKKAVYCTAFRLFHGKGYFATDSTTHITHWMPLPSAEELK